MMIASPDLPGTSPRAIAGLVDEYVLVIKPVVFGSGLPMFGERSDALRLELVAATTFDAGVVVHIYRPVHDS